jgi:hypothetical protein
VDFENATQLYNEVLKNWIIRSVKTPVLTIIKQPEDNMDFTGLNVTGGIASS